MNIFALGIDMVEVGRFRNFVQNDAFVIKVFSVYEIEYCFSFQDPSIHLAGVFAAKEAASKALGVHLYPYIEFEVRHDEHGKPELYHKGIKSELLISISHTHDHAVAIAAR